MTSKKFFRLDLRCVFLRVMGPGAYRLETVVDGFMAYIFMAYIVMAHIAIWPGGYGLETVVNGFQTGRACLLLTVHGPGLAHFCMHTCTHV